LVWFLSYEENLVLWIRSQDLSECNTLQCPTLKVEHLALIEKPD
jgi:hypothetical protein